MHTNKTHSISAFTLLEVMIALLILSVSLTSLMLATIELNKNQTFLKNKTIALWIAQNRVNELRLNLNGQSEQTLSMAKTTWQVKSQVKPMPNKNIEAIHVTVHNQDHSVSHQINATRRKINAEQKNI